VQRGGTAVSVLHEITMALHADEMLVMTGGRVSHQGACSQPPTHRALERVFEGRIAVHALAGQWVALPNEFVVIDEGAQRDALRERELRS
jgi:iron complex transport system ATP-binding protein